MSRLQREGALLHSNERNRLAAQLAEKRRGKQPGGNAAGWSEQEIADMEAGDDEFKRWEDELERLKALIGP